MSWWPGEVSGDDVVGTNGVTPFNGADFAAGMLGQAFRFNGTSQGFGSASPPLTSISNTFTLEFWAFPTASRATTPESNSDISGTGGQRYAIYPEHGGDSGTFAGVGVSVGTNGVSVFEHAMGYLPSLLVYDAPISDWIHIAIVYVDRRPTLYLNGVPVRTGVASQVPVVFPSKTFGDGGYYGPYSGLLDEVAIFDRALSDAEILVAYLSAGSNPCGNVGSWVSCSRRTVLVPEIKGAVTVSILLLRGTNATDLNVTVDYATVEGTARAGEDYVAASGTLHFAAGETNKQIAITILDDALAEREEQFRLVLSNPTGGVSLGSSNVVIRIVSNEPMTYYVNVNNPNPVFPYASWATAATIIQDAVDAARSGDTVLVTNGVYAVGSRGTGDYPGHPEYNLSRVVVANAIRLESVNGPMMTTINGGGSVRCVYLGSNAVLSGLTLTNGLGSYSYGGGGVYSEPSGVLTNCVLTGNRSISHAVSAHGGGAYGGKLYNCTLANNRAAHITMSGYIHDVSGGGAYDSTLYNCTVTGNSADGAVSSTLYDCTVTGNGSGAKDSTLYNCLVTDNDGASGGYLYGCTVIGNNGGVSGTVFNSIIYYNFDGNYAEGTVLNYSCTSPLPTNGVGNITGHPLFMDMASGDFRLREESPCIDAGTNLMGFPITEWRYISEEIGYAWVVVGHITDPTDILGNTRFIDGNFDGRVAWDMGAYEFNSFPPPQFTCAPQRMPDCWRLSITGAPNKWVHIQKSSDLKNWGDLWSGWMGSAGIKQVDDADLSPKAMFYRAVVPQ